MFPFGFRFFLCLKTKDIYNLFEHYTKFGRRISGKAAKHTVERRDRRKAGSERNIGYRDVWIEEQILCICYAALIYIFVKGDPCKLLEQTRKIEFTESGSISSLFQGKVF